MTTKKEIQRLKELGHSQREISKRLQVDRRTIKRYWDSPEPGSTREAPSWVEDVDWDFIRERRAQGVLVTNIYEELVPKSVPLPGYAEFTRRLAKMEKEDSVPKIIPPKNKMPGEEIEIDYSGDSIPFVSPSTGENVPTELFVACPPFSQKFYAEFSLSQNLRSCIESVVKMFSFYGGVPKFLVVDNMKTAVTKYHKYDPFMNRSFLEMAEHYRVGLSPARPYTPKDKPSVERAVGIIQQHLFPMARNRVYHSLAELNRDMRQFLKKFHSRPMQRGGVSRDELFEKEKVKFEPLPGDRYEFSQWKKAKIHQDCHFHHEKNFYSVPWKYVGKGLDIKFNEKTVTAFWQGSLVATHAVTGKNSEGCYRTNPAHFPESRKISDLRNLERLFFLVGKIGDNSLALAKKISEMGVHPLANYKRLLGIINLGKKHSKEAMEYACQMALEMNRANYHYIKNCAESYIPPLENDITKAPTRAAGTIFLQGEFEHERDQETTGDTETVGNA